MAETRETPSSRIIFIIGFMVCAPACLYVYCVHAGTHEGQKGTSDPLGLELYTVRSYHVGARS